MHRGHRHTDCTVDTWTVADRVDSVDTYREALGKYRHTEAWIRVENWDKKRDTLIRTQSHTLIHLDDGHILILAGQSFIVSLAAILILEGLDKTKRLVMITFTFNYSIFTVSPFPLKRLYSIISSFCPLAHG